MPTQVIDFEKEAKAMVQEVEYALQYAIPSPIYEKVVQLVSNKLMQIAHKAILEGEW